jgi:hypothetical protein
MGLDVTGEVCVDETRLARSAGGRRSHVAHVLPQQTDRVCWGAAIAEGMLDRQFPNRRDTEEDFVGRICEDLARCRRQVFRARDDPQERAGIKKALHPWEPSNVRGSSSGRGSKNERGTVNRPLAMSIGRGRAGTWGNGIISATG